MKTRKIKHKHNKNLNEVALGELLATIKYKCEWYNRGITEIGAYFPSTRKCSVCGNIADPIETKIRSWTCSNCGTKHDRDKNASKNIRDEGIRLRKN